MLDKLFPIEHVRRVEDVDYERLFRAGYDTFLFDYDFTLAPWKTLSIDESTWRVFKRLRDMGARVLVVTNAKEERVAHLRRSFPWLEVHSNMSKPSVRKIKRILDEKGIDPRRCVIIGDLFLTDILAGNRLGMYTVMVNPRLYEAREIYKWIVGALSVALYRTAFFFFGWLFRLASLISPNEWAGGVSDIDFDRLIRHGFELFIFDFDNTLAPWRSPAIPEEHLEILLSLQRRGVEVCVVSNGRVRNLSLPFRTLWRAGKPIAPKVRRCLKELGVDPRNVVVIGDQLFTDVLFGNLIGAYTIKTNPLKKEEAPMTKINRLLERAFMKLMVEKPRIGGDGDGGHGEILHGGDQEVQEGPPQDTRDRP